MKRGYPDRRLTAAEVERVSDLWFQGQDTEQIRLALNVAESAVYRELSRQREARWLKRRAHELLGLPA